jgi:hypothetical protein
MMSFLVERVGKKLLSETEINYMALGYVRMICLVGQRDLGKGMCVSRLWGQ